MITPLDTVPEVTTRDRLLAAIWLREARALGCRVSVSSDYGPRMRFADWERLSPDQLDFALRFEDAIEAVLWKEQRDARTALTA